MYDFHIHSNYSLDGTYCVEDLIKMAKNNKCTTIAITDHNCVKGCISAIEFGKQHGIKVIKGIEIDCVYNGIDFHLLAYNINVEDEYFTFIENYYLKQNELNTFKQVRLFEKYYNVEFSENMLKSVVVKNIIVPEDLCAAIIKSHLYDECDWLKPFINDGCRSDNSNVNFYWDYFSQGKIAHVKNINIDFTEILNFIHSQKGLAIIAHPFLNFKDDQDLINCIKLGVDGIEVYSNYHNDSTINKYLDIAKNYNLKITCGSDFHGEHKPMIKIGVHNKKMDINNIYKFD